jgi:hypothetical protein
MSSVLSASPTKSQPTTPACTSADALVLCGGILAHQSQLKQFTATVLSRSTQLSAWELDRGQQLVGALTTLQADLYRLFLCERSHLPIGETGHAKIDSLQVPLDRLLQTLFEQRKPALSEIHRTAYHLDPFIAYYLVAYPFANEASCNGLIHRLTLSDTSVQLVRLVDPDYSSSGSSLVAAVHNVTLKDATLANVVLAARECLLRIQ